MKKEDLIPILQQTFIEFCDCLLFGHEAFQSINYYFIKNRLKSCKFGNFTLYDVIGTQKGFEYIMDNFGIIYRNNVYRRNLFRSIFILQSIRTIISQPIIINSFFRSHTLNSLVNGVDNSYHTQGLAFDIKRTGHINKISVKNALKELRNIFQSYSDIINIIDNVQVIEYTTYLHIELELEA